MTAEGPSTAEGGDTKQGSPLSYTTDFTTICRCGVLCEYEDGQRVDDRCDHVLGEPIDDTTDPEGIVDELLDMTDEDFYRIVSADTRGRLWKPYSDALRHDDVLDRWDGALAQTMTAIMGQLAGKKGDTTPEVRSWRHKALHFQAKLIARRKECRELRVARNVEEAEARAGTGRWHAIKQAVEAGLPVTLFDVEYVPANRPLARLSR